MDGWGMGDSGEMVDAFYHTTGGLVVQWTRGSVSLVVCVYVGTWVHGYVATGLTVCLLACLLNGLLEEGERQGLTLCLLACLLACSLCCVLRDQCYVMLRRCYVDATWMLRRFSARWFRTTKHLHK